MKVEELIMLYFLSIEPNAKLVLMVIGICCILPILVIGLIGIFFYGSYSGLGSSL